MGYHGGVFNQTYNHQKAPMATPVTLPRGVALVKWKKDGKTQLRYRVRMVQKKRGIEVDEYFDDVEDAVAFRALKSRKNPLASAVAVMPSQAPMSDGERLLASFVAPGRAAGYKETIRDLMNPYTEKRFEHEVPKGGTFENLPERRRIALYNEKNKNAVICDTKIKLTRIIESTKNNEFPTAELFKRLDGSSVVEILFGDLLPQEINKHVVSCFIEARKKVKSKNSGDYIKGSTIKREVGMISAFISSLVEDEYKGLQYTKDEPLSMKFKTSVYRIEEKHHPRITAEIEEKIIKVIQPHIQVFQIVRLGILTGMRKAEILILNKKHRDGRYLNLKPEDTKTKAARSVYLVDEAIAILDSITPQANGNYFTYTYYGFNTMRYKLFKQIGVPGLTFHTLRGEFITRILLSRFDKDMEKKLIRIGNAKYFDEKHKVLIEAVRDKSSDGPELLNTHSKDSNVIATTYDRSSRTT